MKPQVCAVKNNYLNGRKAETFLWNLSSELIGVYLWFLKFSNIILKLMQ